MVKDPGKKLIVELNPSDMKWLETMISDVREVVDQTPSKYPDSIKHIRGIDNALKASKINRRSKPLVKKDNVIIKKELPKKITSSAKRTLRTPREKIIRDIQSLKKPFTINQIVQKSKSSPITIRSVIDDMINKGIVEMKGPDARHKGRGRSPMLYKNI